MSTTKHKDFLARRSLAAGDFEELQALFDRSVGQFANELLQPLSISLRAQLTVDLSDGYLGVAKSLLDGMLKAPPDASGREDAAVTVARRFRAALDTSDALPEADIDREVRSCSREVAERVLARWLDKLGRALRAGSSLRLNANLLPGTDSVEETLAGIDFESHGVTRLVVVNALRTYWDGLTREAINSKSPIHLGKRMWIVPDVERKDQPFVLFEEGTAARGFAQGERKKTEERTEVEAPRRPIVVPRRERTRERERDYLELYKHVLASLNPESIPFFNEEMALDIYRVASHRADSLVTWNKTQLESALFGEDYEPERKLMEAVERGVDRFAGGLANGFEAATGLLVFENDISQHLTAFTALRALPEHAVFDVYAHAVLTAVEKQPMMSRQLRLTGDLPEEAAGVDPYKKFAALHHMQKANASKVFNPAFTGSNLATPGLAIAA